jgi:GMP synthase (glutamine-hydrolysing)
MIVLLDLCYRPGSLGEDEFVRPIADIVKNCGYQYTICHYTEWDSLDLRRVRGVILCGTPLKDNLFAENPEVFQWILQISAPVLGICAGMQALALAYGGTIIETPEIGMTIVRSLAPGDPIFYESEWTAYELHRFCGVFGSEFVVLAQSDTCVQAVRHRTDPVYGVIFHPEVRNTWVVERFLNALVRDGEEH